MKNWILKLLVVKTIRKKTGELHFRRFRLFSCYFFSIYIHQFLLPDEDEHLHTHPWNFFNMILKGGYFERLLTNKNIVTKWRRIGYFGYHKSSYAHKIEKVKPNTISLVITGKRKSDWGYITEHGNIQHEEYRKMKRGGMFNVG